MCLEFLGRKKSSLILPFIPRKLWLWSQRSLTLPDMWPFWAHYLNLLTFCCLTLLIFVLVLITHDCGLNEIWLHKCIDLNTKVSLNSPFISEWWSLNSVISIAGGLCQVIRLGLPGYGCDQFMICYALIRCQIRLPNLVLWTSKTSDRYKLFSFQRNSSQIF